MMALVDVEGTTVVVAGLAVVRVGVMVEVGELREVGVSIP